MADSFAVQTIGAGEDPPHTRALLTATTADTAPDAGALLAFLDAHGVTIGPDVLWNVGAARDDEGAVIGWKAEIDADASAVQAAMAAWEAPTDPTPVLEDALATVLAAILAIPEGERSLAEQAALIYASMLRPDLLVPAP